MSSTIFTRIFAVFFVLMAFAADPARAADGSADAAIDKTQGSLDDQFVVTLTINGKVKGEVAPPLIDGCEVVNSGVSHNMQWINGSFSSEDQYTFVIVPRREGTFTVPSWKLNVSGQEITTLPLSFTVKGGAVSQAATAEDIYIERDVPSRAPFVGEAFVSTLRVFHKVQITSATPKRESSPDFRMLSVPGDKTYQRVINGTRWQIIEFKEVLIPLRAGKHSVPPYRLQANVMRANRSLPGGSVFDFFSNRFFGGGGSLHNFFGREEPVEVKGKPVEIEVKPLPAVQPAGFGGLVGQFKLSALPTERQVQAGDSVTFTIVVEGVGSLDTLDKVGDSLRQSGKVYPDKPVLKEEFKPGADGAVELYSRKEFKVAVVPSQTTGSLAPGAVTLVVFNPLKGQYETLSADPGTIEIMASGVANSPVASDAPAPASTSPSPDSTAQPRRKIPVGLLTLILAAVGVGIAAIAWAGRQRQQQKAAERSHAVTVNDSGEGTIETLEPLLDGIDDAGEPSRAGAMRAADLHFDEALRQAQAGMTSQSLVSIEHGLREILAAEAGRRVDAMTPREIRALQINSDIAVATLASLEQVEAVIFSERPVGLDFVQNIVERSRLKKP